MPMWISWTNPKSQKRERIYNYYGMDTPEGQKSIALARRCLSERFGCTPEAIPDFAIEEAEYLAPTVEER